MTTHPFLALMDELLSVPAPPGREERLAQIVRAKLDALGLAHETDPAGNVMVRVPGADPHAPVAALAAHMDEIAVVVTAIEPDGSLRVARSGGLLPHKVGERPFVVVGDGEPVTGILSLGSTHTPDAGKGPVEWKQARIITGMSPEGLAQAGVRVGSSAVPAAEGRGPVVLDGAEDPLVAAWTFDDRAGVATLLRLLEAIGQEGVTPGRPLLVAFTVHEEGGCHGAKVLCQRERPEIFVAVDGCPVVPGSALKLDGRPGVWSKDVKVNFDQRLVADLCRAAREAGTELQVAVFEAAYSDASAVYDVGAAPRVATVGQVRENSHGYEVARLSVFDNLLRTLVEFVRGL